MRDFSLGFLCHTNNVFLEEREYLVAGEELLVVARHHLGQRHHLLGVQLEGEAEVRGRADTADCLPQPRADPRQQRGRGLVIAAAAAPALAVEAPVVVQQPPIIG